MVSISDLVQKIKSFGFRCMQCGTCCKSVSTDSNLVMVSPDEVRSIISFCGLPWDRIAEPYPEEIIYHSGARFTIGWCICRKNGNCRFFENGNCTIYSHRPWICRTYPFMLDNDILVVSPCKGLGLPITREEATLIASNLVERQIAEKEEQKRVRQVLQQVSLPVGKFVVVDSDGIRVMDC